MTKSRAAWSAAAMAVMSSLLIATGPTAVAAAAAPDARAGLGMTFDPVTRSTVLFGGADRFGYQSDTWEWDGAAWTQDAPFGLPTPRNGPGLAYSGPDHQILMFGGQFCSEFGCNDLNDTWLWDDGRWRKQSPATTMPGLPNPAMEYDPVHHRVVLFGAATSNQTWTWDGTDWRRRSPATNPPAVDSEMAFDAPRRRVVLFNANAETWTWDGSTWTKRDPAASPSPRTSTQMSYDAASHRVLLFGGIGAGNADLGDTWTWDGSNWHQETPTRSPPPRGDAGMATDILRQQVVMFGGINDCHPFCSLLGDTWTWDGMEWANAIPPTAPSARDRVAQAPDPVHGNTVVFGGASVDDKPLADTWTWDGGAWTLQDPPTSPPARKGAVMAWDPVTKTDILFGGCCDPNSSTGYWGDTWSWDGTTWTELHPAHAPRGREDAAMGTDEARGRVVLFGGCCALALSAFGDTWVWNGTDWIHKNPGLPPSPRKGAAMAFDPSTNKVLLFGGFNDQTPHSDQTWAWNGSEWDQLFPLTTVPHERSYEGLATDHANGDVVMFGGVGGLIGILGDTWVWTGTDWSQRSAAPNPGPRQYVGMSWDPGGHDVLLFGGCCAAKGDTWTWSGSAWSFHDV